jgi:glycosyltransferase involved in cell wall biosynthesis
VSKQLHIALVAYYWPPSGGSGVQRWLFFANAWVKAGVRVTVFVPKSPRVAETDTSLHYEADEQLTIIPVLGWEPMRGNKTEIAENIADKKGLVAHFSRWIRANFFIPDARVLWAKAAAKAVLKMYKQSPFEVLITTGPPHSLHLVGLNLSKKIPIKWIADFRDPWVDFFQNTSLPMGSRAKKKQRTLQESVVRTADHVVVTAPTLAARFKKMTPAVSVLTNGYQKRLDQQKNPSLGMLHTGSLKAQQNPIQLWAAIAELVKENEAFAANFSLRLYGSVATSIKDSINNYGINSWVHCEGYQPKALLDTILPKAKALLLVGIAMPNTGNIVHGKLFAYMAAGRPVLGIGPVPSDMQELFQTHKLGVYTGFTEIEKIKKTLLQWFTKEKINFASKGIEQYKRSRIAKNYLDLIEALR